MRDVRIWNAFFTARWALEPERFEAMLGVLLRRQRGEPVPLSFDEAEPEARAASGRNRPRQLAGGVAVIPIVGTIGHRMHNVDSISGSGGTSTERVGLMLDEALQNDEIGTVLLDIDSPGGTVSGVPELAEKILRARETKRIVASANPIAASAAYWIGSAAEEFVATPSGDVGSIGVFAVHLDQSAANEAAGVRPTLIGAGKFKTELSPHGPLSDEAIGAVQSRVNADYQDFVKAVGKGRGAKPAEVRGGYGEGRLVRAADAVGENMIDRVESFEQTVGRLRKPVRRRMGDDTRRRRQRARQLSL